MIVTALMSAAQLANELLHLKAQFTEPPELRLLAELVDEVRNLGTRTEAAIVTRSELNDLLQSAAARQSIPLSPTLQERVLGRCRPAGEALPRLTDALAIAGAPVTSPMPRLVVSSFGTAGYLCLGSDGKAVSVFHADGDDSGHCFTVRKGIGWYYRVRLGGVTSFLGLPTSDEHSTAGRPGARSEFEGGHIDWVPQDAEVRVYRYSAKGPRQVATMKL